MKQRWYDKDPTVSLAISLLKNSNDDVKQVCSESIIKLLQEHGVTLPTSLFSKINSTFKRWYDEDKTLSSAMEHLRVADSKLRKEISIEIIQLLQKAEQF